MEETCLQRFVRFLNRPLRQSMLPLFSSLLEGDSREMNLRLTADLQPRTDGATVCLTLIPQTVTEEYENMWGPLLRAILAHECQHVNSSSFDHIARIRAWYAAEMEKAGLPGAIGANLAAMVQNMVEDGRIEQIAIARHPGLLNAFLLLNQVIRQDTAIQEKAATPDKELEDFLGNLLSYAKTGRYAPGAAVYQGTELERAFLAVVPAIESGVNGATAEDCFLAVQDLLETATPYFLSLLKPSASLRNQLQKKEVPAEYTTNSERQFNDRPSETQRKLRRTQAHPLRPARRNPNRDSGDSDQPDTEDAQDATDARPGEESEAASGSPRKGSASRRKDRNSREDSAPEGEKDARSDDADTLENDTQPADAREDGRQPDTEDPQDPSASKDGARTEDDNPLIPGPEPGSRQDDPAGKQDPSGSQDAQGANDPNDDSRNNDPATNDSDSNDPRSEASPQGQNSPEEDTSSASDATTEDGTEPQTDGNPGEGTFPDGLDQNGFPQDSPFPEDLFGGMGMPDSAETPDPDGLDASHGGGSQTPDAAGGGAGAMSFGTERTDREESGLSPEDLERMEREFQDSLRQAEVRERREQDQLRKERSENLTQDELNDLLKRAYPDAQPPFELSLESCPPGPLPTDIRTEGLALRREIERILRNKRASRRNMRSGQLDRTQLWRYGAGADNLFLQPGRKDVGDIAFSLLIDNSGSMARRIESGSAITRTFAARRAAAVIEEALKGQVPCRIALFHCMYAHNHRVLKTFESTGRDNVTWNSLRCVEPQGGNADSVHIRVAAEELLRRPERRRVLIVLSDGTPSAYASIRGGVEEVRQAVEEARRRGLIVISILFASEGERGKMEPRFAEMYGADRLSVDPGAISVQLPGLFRKLLRLS